MWVVGAWSSGSSMACAFFTRSRTAAPMSASEAMWRAGELGVPTWLAMNYMIV
jgi:hypothetical protein